MYQKGQGLTYYPPMNSYYYFGSEDTADITEITLFNHNFTIIEDRYSLSAAVEYDTTAVQFKSLTEIWHAGDDYNLRIYDLVDRNFTLTERKKKKKS